MPTLYGAPLSPFVRKVAYVLEEKSIDYTWDMVRPHSENPDFKAASPLGKIPAYHDDHVAIADSSVICQYLEKTHPSPALYPSIPAEFAHALWLEEYFDSTLIEPMRAVFTYGYATAKFFDKPLNEEKLNQGKQDLVPCLDYIESILEKGRWAASEQFSIADISLTLGFANVALAGYTLDTAAYPKLANLLERAQNRPSYEAVAKKMDVFMNSL